MLTAEELYDKLKHVSATASTCRYTLDNCSEMAVKINEINRLKKEKNAVVLVHSYVSPEIVYGIADYTGDSYALSKNAAETDADTIIFVAVKFMGETAKILNPTKDVLIPSTLNGCSLADSITGDDVRKLREDHPDYTFICYINTTADVKAQCDICVTSGNVYDIVEKAPTDKIFFLPDKLMGYNIIKEMERRGVKKDIKLWDGVCYVHEEYDPEMIEFIRNQHQGVKVLAHPECSPGVLNHSDFVGSTSQLLNYMETADAPNYLMLTECGLTSRLQVEMPDKKFVGTCSMCKYMKANSLDDVLRVLEQPKESDYIRLNPETSVDAKKCIDAMFEFAEKK